MSELYRPGEQWIAVAKKTGALDQGRFFPLKFGIAGSADEMWFRITQTLQLEPDFRNQWKGWNFAVMRADQVIRVDEAGCVLIHRNEHQHVQAHKEQRRPTIVMGDSRCPSR